MKERFVARLRAEASGRYLSAVIAASTRSRMASRTFGSLLRTRETVLVDVPAARATSSMVARIIDTPPCSVVRSRRRFCGGRDLPHPHVPPAHLHDRRLASLRRIACG